MRSRKTRLQRRSATIALSTSCDRCRNGWLHQPAERRWELVELGVTVSLRANSPFESRWRPIDAFIFLPRRIVNISPAAFFQFSNKAHRHVFLWVFSAGRIFTADNVERLASIGYRLIIGNRYAGAQQAVKHLMNWSSSRTWPANLGAVPLSLILRDRFWLWVGILWWFFS